MITICCFIEEGSAMLHVFVVGLVMLGNSIQAGEAEAAKKETAKLQGTWKVTSVIYNGKDFYEKGQTQFDFVIKGDQIVVQGNDAVRKEYARLRFTLDPTTMPKIFDLTVTDGIQAKTKMEGIYQMKGDDLKLCVRIFGLNRPNEFAAAAGSSNALLVLKRISGKE
jgi:uncharacterized protein (TIGR03067 family)